MAKKPKVTEQEADRMAALTAAIVEQPEATKHVQSIDSLRRKSLGDLLALAEQIGIDVEQTIATGKMLPSLNGPEAFVGKCECDLTVSLAGKSCTHRARVLYEYTPNWNWFDTKLKVERLGWYSSSMKFQVLSNQDGRRRWTDVQFEDLLMPEELFDGIDEIMDQRCREIDRQRRTKAAVGKPRGA